MKKSKIIVLTTLATLLLALFPFKAIHAANVNIDISDPTVTKSDGTPINPDETSKWQSYHIKWNFDIPNDTNIQTGDTAIFDLPAGMTANANLSFDVKNQNGDVVGTFVIKQGESNGVLTFNDYYATHEQINRHGSIQITANGKDAQQAGKNDWNVNKSSWINANNQPTWNIAINAGEGYEHFVLEDVASQDQEIDPSSIEIQQGHYDENGKFVAEKNLPVDADVDGNKMTVRLNNISGIVNVSYHTKSEHAGTLTNTATAIEHNGPQENVTTSTNWSDSASITYDGSGDATGDNTSSSSSIESSSSSSIVKPSSSSVESSSSSTVKPSSSSVKSSSSNTVKPSSSSVESSSSSTERPSSSTVKPSSSSVESSSSSTVKPSSSSTVKPSSSSVKSSSSNTVKPSSSSVESSSSSTVKPSSSSVESSSSSTVKPSSSSVESSSSSIVKPSSSSVESSSSSIVKPSSSSVESSSSNKKNGVIGVVTNNDHSNHQNGNQKGNDVDHNNGISKVLPATGEAKTNTMLLVGIALLTIATGMIIKQRRN